MNFFNAIFGRVCYALVYEHLYYITTNENPADELSRPLSSIFGGPGGHTFDLMALDSNAMKDTSGDSLPHFTLGPQR